MTKTRFLACLGLLVVVLMLAVPVAQAEDGLGLAVVPGVVQIDMNYGGADLSVQGTRPEGAGIVVKVTSPATEVKLSKKGRVFGIFWMTTDRVSVEHMPVFHGVYSSAPLQGLLSAEEQTRMGVDPAYVGVTKLAAVVPGDGQSLSPAEADQYVFGLRDLRIKDGLYCVEESAVRAGGGEWNATVRLPSAAPPGEYDVEAYAVKDGQVVAQSASRFQVKKAGIVYSLGTMANQNSTAYGIMAVMVAVAVGLGVGRVFKGGGH